MELALYGVRMVAIAPGYTDIGWPADSHLRQAEKRLPLKRFAAPEEIAKGVAFLASPDATYMTGCVLAQRCRWWPPTTLSDPRQGDARRRYSLGGI